MRMIMVMVMPLLILPLKPSSNKADKYVNNVISMEVGKGTEFSFFSQKLNHVSSRATQDRNHRINENMDCDKGT